MLAERLKFIYKGGKTKRYHTADTLTEQSVAEHSYGVALILTLLTPNPSLQLILSALVHDLAEHLVGDVASPAKRRFPALKSAVAAAEGSLLTDIGLGYASGLTDEEKRLLKIADIMDGMMFCVRERRMGSRAVVSIYNNFYSYLDEMPLNTEALRLLGIINNMWEKYNERS